MKAIINHKGSVSVLAALIIMTSLFLLLPLSGLVSGIGCFENGLWEYNETRNSGRQFWCNVDNTYRECVDGVYVQREICEYGCSAHVACHGFPPGALLNYCDFADELYLRDMCDENCQPIDSNICMYNVHTCTADPDCNDIQNGTEDCDIECQIMFCGDGIISSGEECELPITMNNDYCEQSTTVCNGHLYGVRDSLGNCDSGCACTYDTFSYSCMEGECGAECDSGSDYYSGGGTCYYSCDYEEECDYQSSCSLESYCSDNVYYYSGSCSQFGCTFQSHDCSSDDYFGEWVYYCEGDGLRRHRLHYTHTCTQSGCQESAEWVDDELYEDCNENDGDLHEECGIEDWTCIEGEPDHCGPSGVIPDDSLCENYCDGMDRYYNGECNEVTYLCEYDSEFCGEDGYYCYDDEIYQTDFTCTPDQCMSSEPQFFEDCSEDDGWYNYGNVPGSNDPECEYQNWYCTEDQGGDAYCDDSITESHDYDILDGAYCMDDYEAIENRDYYCTEEGTASYQPSNYHDCGTEQWIGGGNIEGYGNDPECEYVDYYCFDTGTSDYCKAEASYFIDYDYLDIEECQPQTSWFSQHDYYCDISTCDWLNPENLCDWGDEWYNPQCSVECNSECETSDDCDDSSCYVVYEDTCEGYMLKDWNGNREYDTMEVSDFIENTCSGMDDCACTHYKSDCSAIPEGVYCVEDVCDAECDEDSDCEPFCGEDETYFYGGECDLEMYCDCSYLSEDCDDYDEEYNAGQWCDPQFGDIFWWYEDWGCGEQGCEWTGDYLRDGVAEDCEDVCEDTDGGIEYGQQGTVTDWELCTDQMGECPYQTYGDYCEGDILHEYYCECGDMGEDTIDCGESNHKDDWEYYCNGDEIWRHRLYHDFACTPGGCIEITYWVDYELFEDCNDDDGWYNYGNYEGSDDPECEYQDWTCTGEGEVWCTYDVSESHDYDTLDGAYCADGDESIENRDYYCGPDGLDYYAVSGYHDCGTEYWFGGGNTEGYGNDPECRYKDYWCVDSGVKDYCTSGNTYTDDYDYLDTEECQPETIWLFQHDYYCDLSACDSLNPENLCGWGDEWYNPQCSVQCGAECGTDDDCAPYIDESDYCWFGRVCTEDCGCAQGQYKYCPEPGTTSGIVCYYGNQECTENGCQLDYCILDYNEYCDPEDGCVQIPCVEIPDITTFSDGSAEKMVEFMEGGGSNDSVKLSIPVANMEILSASVDLTGLPKSTVGERSLDVVAVNDVSGSMAYNCNPDGTADPQEPPCNIESMKNATKDMIDAVLSSPDNMMGLVSYNTEVADWMDLTDDAVALKSHVDLYEASDKTCISCGISKGIDILSSGTNEVRAMLLMTDGNANRCTYGLCNTYTAGQEAISEAQRAYDDYGISIYTVAFGDDADISLLQEIANVSGGKLYIADGTNISDVYQEIAVEITNIYPFNPWLDVGKDGDHEWFYTGSFDTTETADFQGELDSLKDCICTGCTVDGTHCVIDMETFSEEKGFISLSDILIEICVYTTDPTSYPGAPELCDGKDNDGDLDIDEDFTSLGSFCTAGVGACQRSGVYVCSGDMLSTVCNAVPGSPAAEICDGVDNDCDGAVDEGVCITTTSGGSSGGGGGGVSEYCGNMFCASTENCTTCPKDCGECPPPETGEGEQCVPDWSCTAWSECSPEGSQTRDCTDLNACEGAFSGPVTEQPCAYQQAGAGQTDSTGMTGFLILDPVMGLYWAAIITMVVLGAGIIIWKRKGI